MMPKKIRAVTVLCFEPEDCRDSHGFNILIVSNHEYLKTFIMSIYICLKTSVGQNFMSQDITSHLKKNNPVH